MWLWIGAISWSWQQWHNGSLLLNTWSDHAAFGKYQSLGLTRACQHVDPSFTIMKITDAPPSFVDISYGVYRYKIIPQKLQKFYPKYRSSRFKSPSALFCYCMIPLVSPKILVANVKKSCPHSQRMSIFIAHTFETSASLLSTRSRPRHDRSLSGNQTQ